MCIRDSTMAAALISIMGMLYLGGTRLGPIEGLGLSVVIGVSVDYLVHFAFAYKHSLIATRYFKSRATVLARIVSTSSAAATTLVSVTPSMLAKLTPLRLFGSLFFVVVIVAFAFSIFFFLPLMMICGPLTSWSSEAIGMDSGVPKPEPPAAVAAVLAPPIDGPPAICACNALNTDRSAASSTTGTTSRSTPRGERRDTASAQRV